MRIAHGAVLRIAVLTTNSEDQTMTINAQSVAYRDNYTELTGEFVWDAGRSDKRPGILVVHGGIAMEGHPLCCWSRVTLLQPIDPPDGSRAIRK